MCKEHLHKMCVLVLGKILSHKYITLAIDPFLDHCYESLLGVVCDVISDAAAGQEAIAWMSPFSRGFADDVAHDTKKRSTARAREGINASGSFAFAFAYLRYCVRTYIRCK